MCACTLVRERNKAGRDRGRRLCRLSAEKGAHLPSQHGWIPGFWDHDLSSRLGEGHQGASLVSLIFYLNSVCKGWFFTEGNEEKKQVSKLIAKLKR